MARKNRRRNPAYDDRGALEMIEQHIRRVIRSGQGWATRHADALVEGLSFTATSLAVSGGIAQALYGWAAVADAHRERFGSVIGQDRILGAHWIEMAQGLMGLLNGDIGHLDGGEIDGLIRDIAEANGYEGDEL